MNVGELFVNLGIRGADKTLGNLSNITKGFGGLKSMSLESKAAILGSMYAIERMMSSSAMLGSNMENFTALTGQSSQALQQWGNAAALAGGSMDGVKSSIMGMRAAFTEMLVHGKGIESFQWVGRTLRAAADANPADKFLQQFKDGISREQVEKMINDNFYGLQVMRAYSGAETNSMMRQNNMSAFGVDMGTQTAMLRGGLTDQKIAAAPFQGAKSVKALAQVDAHMEQVKQKIEKAFQNFTAKHGDQLVTDIDKITTAIIGLADALATLADKTKVFQVIAWSIDKVAYLTNLFGTDQIDSISGNKKKGDNDARFGKGSLTAKALNWRDSIDSEVMGYIKGGNGELSLMDAALRASRGEIKGTGASVGDTNVTVNQNIGPGHDAKSIAEHTKRAVHQATHAHHKRVLQQAHAQMDDGQGG